MTIEQFYEQYPDMIALRDFAYDNGYEDYFDEYISVDELDDNLKNQIENYMYDHGASELVGALQNVYIPNAEMYRVDNYDWFSYADAEDFYDDLANDIYNDAVSDGVFSEDEEEEEDTNVVATADVYNDIMIVPIEDEDIALSDMLLACIENNEREETLTEEVSAEEDEIAMMYMASMAN